MATTEQVAELVAAMQALQQRVAGAETAAEGARARQEDAERMLQQTMAAAAATATPLVDTRAFGKVSTFSGARAEWSDWKFTFQAYMSGANPAAAECMRWSEQQKQAITDEEVDRQSPAAKQLSKQLYLALSLQVRNEALSKVRNVEMNNGLEAWRRLVEEYEPSSRGRQMHALNQLLRAEPATSIDTVLPTIEEWERNTRE